MEYKLRMNNQNNQQIIHNIMKISANNTLFSLDSLNPPIHLHRSSVVASSSSSSLDKNSQEKKEEKKGKRAFQKKTKLYYNYNSSSQQGDLSQVIRRRELNNPWLLSDTSTNSSSSSNNNNDELSSNLQVQLSGSYLPQHSNYCLFVYDEDLGEFLVIPISNWYKFQQQYSSIDTSTTNSTNFTNAISGYRTLTIDEAEAEMKRAQSALVGERWLMRRLNQSTLNNQSINQSNNQKKKNILQQKLTRASVEELVHEEHFDDDEEYGWDVEGEDDRQLGAISGVVNKDSGMDGVSREMLRKRDMQQLLDGYGSVESRDYSDLEMDSENGDIEDDDDGDEKKKVKEKKETVKLLKKMNQDFLEGKGGNDDDDDPFAEYFGSDYDDDDDGDDDDSDTSLSENEKKRKKYELEKKQQSQQVTPSASPLPKQSSQPLNLTGNQKAIPSQSQKQSRVLAGSAAGGASPSGSFVSLSQPIVSSKPLLSSTISKRGASSASDSDDTRPHKKPKQGSSTSSDQITQDEIIALFKSGSNSNSVTTTLSLSELISKLGKKAKKSGNRELLKVILKRVCTKSGDGLSLKPDFI